MTTKGYGNGFASASRRIPRHTARTGTSARVGPGSYSIQGDIARSAASANQMGGTAAFAPHYVDNKIAAGRHQSEGDPAPGRYTLPYNFLDHTTMAGVNGGMASATMKSSSARLPIHFQKRGVPGVGTYDVSIRGNSESHGSQASFRSTVGRESYFFTPGQVPPPGAYNPRKPGDRSILAQLEEARVGEMAVGASTGGKASRPCGRATESTSKLLWASLRQKKSDTDQRPSSATLLLNRLSRRAATQAAGGSASLGPGAYEVAKAFTALDGYGSITAKPWSQIKGKLLRGKLEGVRSFPNWQQQKEKAAAKARAAAHKR